jgi:hypothetical protein
MVGVLSVLPVYSVWMLGVLLFKGLLLFLHQGCSAGQHILKGIAGAVD